MRADHDRKCAILNGGDCDCSNPFDEHAADMDAWREDQARLRAAEARAHGTIMAALDRVGAILDASGPSSSRVDPARSCASREPAYRSALDREGGPAPVDSWDPPMPSHDRYGLTAHLRELVRLARAVGEAWDAPAPRGIEAVGALLERADLEETRPTRGARGGGHPPEKG